MVGTVMAAIGLSGFNKAPTHRTTRSARGRCKFEVQHRIVFLRAFENAGSAHCVCLKEDVNIAQMLKLRVDRSTRHRHSLYRSADFRYSDPGDEKAPPGGLTRKATEEILAPGTQYKANRQCPKYSSPLIFGQKAEEISDPWRT